MSLVPSQSDVGATETVPALSLGFSFLKQNAVNGKFVQKLSISNFYCFRLAEKEDRSDAFYVNFNIPNGHGGSGLTVLIGENNGGKSTVLRAIELFSGRAPSPHTYTLNAEGQRNDAEIKITAGDGNEFSLKTKTNGDSLEWGKKGELRCVKANKSVTQIFDTVRFMSELMSVILDSPELFPQSAETTRTAKSIKKTLDNVQSPEISSFFKGVFAYAKIGREFLKNVFNVTLADGCKRIPSDPEVIEKKPHGHAVPVWQTGDGALLGSHLIGIVQKHREDGCRLFLLDEPEQNLHPKAVEALIKELWEISKDTQIILTSHSPVLVEAVCRKAQTALLHGTGGKPEDYFRILSKDAGTGNIRSQPAKPFLLNPVSADEINYCAFDCIRENYFVQLYDILQYRWAQLREKEELRQREMDEIFNEKGYPSDQTATLKDKETKETIFTYQRNALAHPTNKSRTFKSDKLEYCVEELRKLLKEADIKMKPFASSQILQSQHGKSTQIKEGNKV